MLQRKDVAKAKAFAKEPVLPLLEILSFLEY